MSSGALTRETLMKDMMNMTSEKTRIRLARQISKIRTNRRRVSFFSFGALTGALCGAETPAAEGFA